MRILKYLGIIAAAACLAVSCKQDLPTYDTLTTNVYFAFGNVESNVTDSTSLAILKNGSPVDSVIKVNVVIMGQPVGYDRPIAFEIPADGYSSAVAGRDLELLTTESFIPANSVKGAVKIKLLNSDELTAAGSIGLKFKVRLLPNEHFTTNLSSLSDKTVDDDEERKKYKMNSLNFKIRFNNDTQESILWNSETYGTTTQGVNQHKLWVDMWGKFSPEKVKMIIEASDGGITEDELYPYWEYIISQVSGRPLPPPTSSAYTYAVMQVYNSSRRNATWAANFNKMLAHYKQENNGKDMIDTYNTARETDPAKRPVLMTLGETGKGIF